MPVGWCNRQTNLSVPDSTLGVPEGRVGRRLLHLRRPRCRAVAASVDRPVPNGGDRGLGRQPVEWHPRGVLKELRGPQGEPHLGTRLVALVLALLLAAPLTYVAIRFVAYALHQVL